MNGVLEAVKEVWRGVVLGPPGLARMCVHPEEAHDPSYEEDPRRETARICKICGSQCA